jgi:hypothetical protein
MTTYKIVNKDTKLIGKRVEKKPVPVVKRFDASTLKAVVLDDVDEFNPPSYVRIALQLERVSDLLSYDPFVSRFIPNWPENLPEDASQPIIIATSSADDSNALRRIEFIEEVVYRRSFLDDLQETWWVLYHCPCRH